MLRSVIVAAVMFAFSLSATAQTKTESIKKLFVLMKQDSLLSTSFEIMTKSMIDGMRASLAQTTGQEIDTVYAQKFATILRTSMESSKELSRTVLNVELVRIYDSLFTQKEIDDFIVFYKSPSGQKMINSIPAIQKDLVSVLSVKYSPKLQQDITNGIMEMLEEMKKEKEKN